MNVLNRPLLEVRFRPSGDRLQIDVLGAEVALVHIFRLRFRVLLEVAIDVLEPSDADLVDELTENSGLLTEPVEESLSRRSSAEQHGTKLPITARLLPIHPGDSHPQLRIRKLQPIHAGEEELLELRTNNTPDQYFPILEKVLLFSSHDGPPIVCTVACANALGTMPVGFR